MEAQGLNVCHAYKIATLEHELIASQSLFVSSSFSKFSKEAFKDIALNIQEDHKNLLVELLKV